MQAHEDALALLTSAPQKTANTSMENLLSIHDAQEDCDSLRETFDTNQRKTILEELSDILHLRGRLQQMGTTFSDNGELLTYGNPSSPSDFEAMIRLGPLYDEQWNTFFVENHVTPDHGGENAQLWSGLRTLKKLLRNEGIVFGRQHQPYSFGDSSIKLRRLCCAYDELRNEWLAMLRTSLPAGDNTQLVALLEDESSSEDDSGFGDDDVQRTDATVLLDTNESHDMTCRPRTLHHRTSGTPQAIGWRFSEEFMPPPRKNATWRFSDDLSSVPVWRDIEQSSVKELQAAPETGPIARNYGYNEANAMQEDTRPVTAPSSVPMNLMLHGPSSLQNMNTQSMVLRDKIGSTSGGCEVMSKDVAKAMPAQEAAKEHGKSKRWGKIRRWFRHPLGRK